MILAAEIFAKIPAEATRLRDRLIRYAIYLQKQMRHSGMQEYAEMPQAAQSLFKIQTL